MCYIEETINAPDGVRLYTRRHEVEGARTEIIIVHGFGEHSGRYGPITDHLVSRGYSVTAYDQRGHGQSEGLPGHVERFADYEADLERIVSSVRARSDADMFIIGHSMGGLVTLRFLAATSHDLRGVVLSAPLIGVAAQVPAHKVMIAKVGGRVVPRMRLGNGIDPAVLSRDPEVGKAYANDPLVNRLVSTRWFAEATRAMEEVATLAPRISLPMLVMHGTDDKLASAEATRRAFSRIGSTDKELFIYPGFYHELFNEPEKQEVYERVAAWIDARRR